VIDAFGAKKVQVVAPQAIVNNASYTCNVIDTEGYDYLEVDVNLGASDNTLAALKLQESDAKASSTTLTSGVDIAGTRFGTDNNDTGSASTLPASTDHNKLFTFFVDLRARKRYILPVITVGNGASGSFVSVTARLSRAEQGPRTAAQAGYAQRMIV
jgi:hypothetical protein